MIGISILVLLAGILVAFLWQEMTLLGAVLCVLGAVFIVRGVSGFLHSKGMLALGEMGLYWKESGEAVADKIFLKWEVIEHIRYETIKDKRYLAVVCAFGTYHLPDIDGAENAIRSLRPELLT